MDTINVDLSAGVVTPVLSASDDWSVISWFGQYHDVEFFKGAEPQPGLHGHLLHPGDVLARVVFGDGAIWAVCSRDVTLVIS